MDSTGNQIDTSFKTIMAFVLRHLKIAVAVAMIVWCWTLIYSFTAYHPKFSSQSLVLIKDSAITSRYVVPDQYYALQTTSSSSSNPVLNTMGLLKSEAISAALWQYFKTKHPQELKKIGVGNRAEWDAFYEDGSRFVKAKNQGGTDLIAITFTWTDPVIAKEALDVVVHAFTQASLDINKSEQHRRGEYLHNQVAQIEKKLTTIRRQKSEFKSKVGTINAAKESDELARLGLDLVTKLNQIDATARGKEAEFERYQTMLKMSPETAITASAVGLNGTMARLRDELYEKTQSYALLKTTLTEKNPKVQEVRAQISQIEQDIKDELTRTLGKSVKSSDALAIADSTRGTLINQMVAAQSEAIRLRTEADVTRDYLSAINKQIEGFPEIEETLANIEEQERSLSNALYTLRQKQLEAQMKEAETLSNVVSVDSPKKPYSAKFPSRPMVWVLGFLMGIAAGAGSLAVLYQGQKTEWGNLISELFTSVDAEQKAETPIISLAHPEPLNIEEAIPMPVVTPLESSRNDDETDAFLESLFRERVQNGRYAARQSERQLREQRLKERLYASLLSARQDSSEEQPSENVKKVILS